MSVTVSTYAGNFGWYARKYLPHVVSSAYLKLQYLKRKKASQEYIEYFCSCKEKPQPLNFLIETINRCNSTCEFCSANIHAENRPFCRMEQGLFEKVIDQIAEWDYAGYISLFVNNEPFMDTRVIEQHKYIREKLPKARIKVFTNGLLLTVEKFIEIAPYVDLFIINNYCEDKKLHKNVEELYEYLKAHPELHENMEVRIQVRYIKEVLTNRAGTAPNKKAGVKTIKEPCLFPYTDMVIYPNGIVGICCCDVKEVTNLGDANKEALKDIWTGERYENIRRQLRKGRDGYPFCSHCDFVDTGLRVQICKEQNHKKQESEACN